MNCQSCARIFTGIFISVIGVLTALVIYWLLLDNNKVVTQKSAEWINADGKQITSARAGDTVYIRRETCNSMAVEIPIVTGRRLIRDRDGIIFPIASSAGYMPSGCLTRAYALRLPPEMPRGVYSYIASLSYAQNPLLETVVKMSAPPLEVMP